MARGKRSVHSKKRRRRILAAAEGYSGARSRHIRAANEQRLTVICATHEPLVASRAHRELAL